MSRGFSGGGGGTSEKSLPMEEIAIDFVYSRQQEIKTFSFKGDNVKILLEVIIATFLYALPTRKCPHGKQ